MKKTLSLVLALVLALGVFCAPALAAEYPLVSEPVTVSGLIEKESVGNERILWKELEKLTGIHVEWTAVESDSMPVFLAAGNWPDFFHFTLDSAAINDYGILGGKFVDYNAHLDEMPNFVQSLADYSELTKAITETNGAIYQLPYIEESATTCQARVYYREDTLRDAGCEMPTTTEEFYEVLKKLKEYNNGAAPLIVSIFSGSYFEPFMYASFGPSRVPDFEDDGEGNVVFNRTSEQYKRFLTYMNQLYKEGLLHQEYLTLDGTTRLSLAQEGLGVFMDGTAHSLTEGDFKSGKCEIGVLAPLTSEFDSERVVMGQYPFSGGSYAINADSKYVSELCKLFDILYATEEVAPGTGLYGEAGCYGPEGMMWKFADDEHNYYEFTLPEGYEGSTTNYQYDEMIYTNSGRATALAHAVTSTPGNAQSRQLGFVNNLIPYHEDTPFPTKFLKFTEDEQFVLDNNYVEIKSKVEEMRSQFITGVADIEQQWDAYVNELNAMGLDEVLKVYQASFDRWNGKD